METTEVAPLEVHTTDPSTKEIVVRAIIIPLVGVLVVSATTALVETLKKRRTKKASNIIETTATEA